MRNKRLAAERNLMSTLINSIPDRIYVKDIDGKYIHSNPAHYKSFGLQSQEELIGKTTLDFFPNDEAASNVKDDLKVILTGKEIINSEEKSFWNGDQISWHHVTKVPLRDQQNNITGIICISRDITQSKKIQEQLQSSEARFRHIINAVSAVLYTVKISGSDFERIWVGDNITQFGYNTKEVLEDAWLYNAIHPDDIEYVKSKIKSVLIKEKLVLEYRLKCKDGRYIWITDETVLIRNEDGKPSELFGSWLDITERMKAQENLLTSESQLSVALRIAHLSHWEYDFTEDKLILNDQFYSLLHSSVDREGGYEMSFSQY